MTLISSTDPAARPGLLTRLVCHAVKVTQDPEFQQIVRSEAGRFVSVVARAAHATSLRVRG